MSELDTTRAAHIMGAIYNSSGAMLTEKDCVALCNAIWELTGRKHVMFKDASINVGQLSIATREPIPEGGFALGRDLAVALDGKIVHNLEGFTLKTEDYNDVVRLELRVFAASPKPASWRDL